MNLLTVMACGLALLGVQRGVDQGDPAVRAFEQGDYEKAREVWSEQLDEGGGGWMVLYNLACAESMLGNTEQGVEYLLDSIGHGFVDFHTMERDAHLDRVRDTPRYALVIQNWRKLLDARGEAELVGLSEVLDDGYAFDRDASLRVHYISALGDEGIGTARKEVERVTAWAGERVFGTVEEDEDRPSAWVSVIVPTRRDFFRFIRGLGVGGIYDKDQKRLVTQDVGASLRHEFFHVLHWRDMAQWGQEHAYWVMEGLASVVEDVEGDGAGGLKPVESWRTNIVKRLERRGLLTKWPVLFKMKRERFVGSRGRAYYAQARAVFMFMDERGVLREWYEEYVDGFEGDPSGLVAVEAVFDQPAKEVEREFRVWIRGLEEVAEQAHPGSAGLGISVKPGRGDGVVVDQIVAGARDGAEWIEGRLRKGDVVLSIDRQATPTLDEYYRVLGGYEVGDEVSIEARRGTRRLALRARLVEEQSEYPR